MLLAVVLLAVVQRSTGLIEVNGRLGWDGANYKNMIQQGWDRGSANSAVRPLVVWINQPAYRMTGDVVVTFQAMNYAYIAALCLALCAIFDRYNSNPWAKLLLIVNLFVSIGTVKYAAFYPVLVDPGAMAVIAWAIYFILTGQRWNIAAVTTAAVLSREFAVAAVAFGVVRDLRNRVPLARVAATYMPAVVVFGVWRWQVMSRFSAEGPLTMGTLFGNLSLWGDPAFATFFAYFALTVFGGVSMFVLVWPRQTLVRLISEEPEWGAFCAVILVASAAGDADIWRYLAYLLPAFAAMFAVGARWAAFIPRKMLALAALVCVSTLITQRPFQAMDNDSYFRDWFPYYLYIGGEGASLWPLWAWRLLSTVSLVCAFAALRKYGVKGRLHAAHANGAVIPH